MPYIKVIYTAGMTVEVCKHFSGRYGKRGKREPHAEPTTEAQKEINERNAEDKLRRLINTNFGLGDWHLVLGYNRKYNKCPEDARKDKEQFLREYRNWCAGQNRVPRYITVTEYKAKRIHHHLVIEPIPLKDLYEMWPWGRPHITPLDVSGNYAQLASYLIKETSRTFKEAGAAQHKRWTQSKGLKKPDVQREIIKAETWINEPKPLKGYYVQKESIRSGTHEVTGYEYQTYIMVRLPDRKAGRKRE